MEVLDPCHETIELSEDDLEEDSLNYPPICLRDFPVL